MLFIDIDKMATAGSKRSRKPNFKQEELQVSALVDEVEKNKTVILGKFSDTVSNERKKQLWISIATNQCCETTYSVTSWTFGNSLLL